MIDAVAVYDMLPIFGLTKVEQRILREVGKDRTIIRFLCHGVRYFADNYENPRVDTWLGRVAAIFSEGDLSNELRDTGREEVMVAARNIIGKIDSSLNGHATLFSYLYDTGGDGKGLEVFVDEYGEIELRLLWISKLLSVEPVEGDV